MISENLVNVYKVPRIVPEYHRVQRRINDGRARALVYNLSYSACVVFYVIPVP